MDILHLHVFCEFFKNRFKEIIQQCFKGNLHFFSFFEYYTECSLFLYFTHHENWLLFNCNYKVDVVVLPFNVIGAECTCCENVDIGKFHFFS